MYSLWGMLNVTCPQFGSGHLELKEFFHPRKPSNPQPGPSSPAEIPEQKEANLFESNTLRRHRYIPKEVGERGQTSSRGKPQQDQKGGLNRGRFLWPLGLVGDIRASPFPDLRSNRSEYRGKSTETPSMDPSPTKRDFRNPACSGKWLDQGTRVKAQLKGCCRVVRWGFYTHIDMPEENEYKCLYRKLNPH